MFRLILRFLQKKKKHRGIHLLLEKWEKIIARRAMENILNKI